VTPLRMRGVTKRYGDTVALDNVDLTVAAGEVHALAGPNGSGKTTLLDIALGRLAPDPEPSRGTERSDVPSRNRASSMT